jgi:hypothetical protein
MGERTDVHDNERSGRPSVMSDDLVQSVDQKKFLKDSASQFQTLSYEFPQITHTFL